MSAKDFTKLKVWQRSRELIRDCYCVTSTFPRGEVFGLVSQIRRCCISVAANIAEGYGRGGDAEFARFLRIASGSANELGCLLILAADLEFLREVEPVRGRLVEIKKLLAALLRVVGSRP